MAAELFAACSCLLQAIYIANLLGEIFGVTTKIFLYIDAKDVIFAVKNLHFTLPKDRSLILSLRQLRQQVAEYDVAVTHCPTKANLADIMTKCKSAVDY